MNKDHKVVNKHLTAKQSNRYGESVVNGEIKTYKRGMPFDEYTPWFRKSTNRLLESQQNIVLDEYEIADYLNREDVRLALNIPHTIQAWENCNHETVDYKCLEEGSFWIYPLLKSSKLRILIYSGDTDGAVPHTGTQEWIR